MSRPPDPGREALRYDASRVSWPVAEAVSRAPARSARAALYAIVALLAGSVAYAQLTRIRITVEGKGAIRSSVKSIPVKSEVAGRVAVLAVRDNDVVTRGQPLAELEDQVDPTTLAAAKRLIERLDGLARSSGSSAAETAGAASDVMTLDIPSMVRERSTLAASANAFHQALRGVEDVGALNAADAAERRDNLAKIARLRRQGLDLRSEIAELQRSVGRLTVSIRSRNDDAALALTSARASLAVQIRSFEQALAIHVKTHRVVAPAGGVATQVAVSGSRELVSPGQVLAQIIPTGGTLVAEVAVANRDIADIQVGLPVALALDALPERDFGVLTGRIAEIPADAVVVDTQPGALPVYLLKVALDRTQLEGRAGTRPVILGMTVTAEIEINTRTLLELAVRQIMQLKEGQ